MLENLRIQGFKCFRDFHIGGIRRLNLLAGKNSAGKSALLEAIRLYQHPDLDGLLEILECRDEISPEQQVWSTDVLLPLFRLPGENGASGRPRAIRVEGERLLELELVWSRRLDDGTWARLDDHSVTEWFRDPALRQELFIRLPHPTRSHLFVLALDGSVRIDTPTARTRRAERHFLRYAAAAERPLVYLRSEALDSDSLSELFESIVATDRETVLNEMLRWVVPDAERLVTKGSGSDRAVFLKRRVASSPEPLKRFGDGITRLSAIALAVANSAGGCCLIDEIENGIHYELLGRLWETLSAMSKAFDVQVFATTHSKDCIEAFERSFQSPNFDACFYRLERSGDDIKSVRLDHEHFFSVVAGREYEIR